MKRLPVNWETREFLYESWDDINKMLSPYSVKPVAIGYFGSLLYGEECARENPEAKCMARYFPSKTRDSDYYIRDINAEILERCGFKEEYLIHSQRGKAGHYQKNVKTKHIPYTSWKSRNCRLDVFVKKICCIEPDGYETIDGINVLRRYDLFATSLFPSAATELRMRKIMPLYACMSSWELDRAEKKILDATQEFHESLPEESQMFLTKEEFERDVKKTRNKIDTQWFTRDMLNKYKKLCGMRDYLLELYEEIERTI